MKIKKLIVFVVMGIMLLSTMAFASETTQPQANSNQPTQVTPNKVKVDPVQRLENLKTKLTDKYNQGKISKDKYDKAIAKINQIEQKIKDFNNMTLDQKKQTLINDYNTAINKRVQQGKLTQDKANELIKNYTDKVNKWDGNGYPPALKHLYGNFFKNFPNSQNNTARFKNALDQAVKDGKITSQQEQDILNYLKAQKDKTNNPTSKTTSSNTQNNANTL